MTKEDETRSDEEPKAFIFRFLPSIIYDKNLMRKLKLGEHRILWLLLGHADNRDGTMYPSLERLIEYSTMAEKEVLTALRGLAEKGILTTLRKGGGRRSGSHKGQSTKRQLLLGKGVTPGKLPGVNEGGYSGKAKTDTPGKSGGYSGKASRTNSSFRTPQKTTHSESGESSPSASPLETRPSKKSKSLETRSDGKQHLSDDGSWRPCKIESELMKSTGLERNGSTTPEWLEKLVRATNDLSKDEWACLSDTTGDWFNDAAVALKKKRPIPDPATYVKDRILQRWEEYGVTRVAARLLEEQGREWCESVLRTCDKKREADGGDPEIASRWARKFAKDPDSFHTDYSGPKKLDHDFRSKSW